MRSLKRWFLCAFCKVCVKITEGRRKGEKKSVKVGSGLVLYGSAFEKRD